MVNLGISLVLVDEVDRAAGAGEQPSELPIGWIRAGKGFSSDVCGTAVVLSD